MRGDPREVEMQCYRVWFRDGSAVLIDAETLMEARRIARAKVKAGEWAGAIERVECLD